MGAFHDRPKSKMQSHLNGPDSMRRMESCLDDILVDEYSSNVSGLVDSQMNILLDLLVDVNVFLH